MRSECVRSRRWSHCLVWSVVNYSFSVFVFTTNWSGRDWPRLMALLLFDIRLQIRAIGLNYWGRNLAPHFEGPQNPHVLSNLQLSINNEKSKGQTTCDTHTTKSKTAILYTRNKRVAANCCLTRHSFAHGQKRLGKMAAKVGKSRLDLMWRVPRSEFTGNKNAEFIPWKSLRLIAAAKKLKRVGHATSHPSSHPLKLFWCHFWLSLENLLSVNSHFDKLLPRTLPQ